MEPTEAKGSPAKEVAACALEHSLGINYHGSRAPCSRCVIAKQALVTIEPQNLKLYVFVNGPCGQRLPRGAVSSALLRSRRSGCLY
eukprot:6189831-Amphidinium_carterae.1